MLWDGKEGREFTFQGSVLQLKLKLWLHGRKKNANLKSEPRSKSNGVDLIELIAKSIYFSNRAVSITMERHWERVVSYQANATDQCAQTHTLSQRLTALFAYFSFFFAFQKPSLELTIKLKKIQVFVDFCGCTCLFKIIKSWQKKVKKERRGS